MTLLYTWLSAGANALMKLFPVGQFNGVEGGNVTSWSFTGTNTGTGGGGFDNNPVPPNTGMDAITIDASTYLEFYANGVFLGDWGSGQVGQGLLSVASNIIPINGYGYALGQDNSPWPLITTGAIKVMSNLTARQVVIKPGGYGGAIVGYGMDMSDDYGAAYFRCYDPGTNLPVDNVWSVKPVNGLVTQILGDPGTGAGAGYNALMTAGASVNGTAGSITLAGASASGSGAGGNILLTPGTSGSGAHGNLFIPSVAADPVTTPATYTGHVALTFNTTNNKLWIYNGSWKSVQLG